MHQSGYEYLAYVTQTFRKKAYNELVVESVGVDISVESLPGSRLTGPCGIARVAARKIEISTNNFIVFWNGLHASRVPFIWQCEAGLRHLPAPLSR